LKCSIGSPNPGGNSLRQFCKSASSLPGFGEQQMIGDAHREFAWRANSLNTA